MAVFSTGGITPPSYGLSASDLSVGSSVYLMMNGSAAEYLVVNQGNPNSALYDASCDGTWLLMKGLYEGRQWHSSNSNSYKASTIHSYLNSTFLGLLDADIQAVVKEVKIPYVNETGGSAVASGANGLSAKIFLMSSYEVGFTTAVDSGFPVDGAKLDYFVGGNDSTAQAKRIANLNGTATGWWLRSPSFKIVSHIIINGAWYVDTSGSYSSNSCSSSYGIRPALILPYSAKFDKDTLVLKG